MKEKIKEIEEYFEERFGNIVLDKQAEERR